MGGGAVVRFPRPFLQQQSTDLEEKIRELVAALTPISDIAILLGMDEIELRDAIDEYENPISIAYRKAKAEVALDIRKAHIALAQEGDKDAAEKVAEYFLNMTRDE